MHLRFDGLDAPLQGDTVAVLLELLPGVEDIQVTSIVGPSIT